MAKKRVTLSLDEETIKAADVVAKDLGIGRSAYISFLINTMESITSTSRIKPNDVAQDLADLAGKTLEIPE